MIVEIMQSHVDVREMVSTASARHIRGLMHSSPLFRTQTASAQPVRSDARIDGEELVIGAYRYQIGMPVCATGDGSTITETAKYWGCGIKLYPSHDSGMDGTGIMPKNFTARAGGDDDDRTTRRKKIQRTHDTGRGESNWIIRFNEGGNLYLISANPYLSYRRSTA